MEKIISVVNKRVVTTAYIICIVNRIFKTNAVNVKAFDANIYWLAEYILI